MVPSVVPLPPLLHFSLFLYLHHGGCSGYSQCLKGNKKSFFLHLCPPAPEGRLGPILKRVLEEIKALSVKGWQVDYRNSALCREPCPLPQFPELGARHSPWCGYPQQQVREAQHTLMRMLTSGASPVLVNKKSFKPRKAFLPQPLKCCHVAPQPSLVPASSGLWGALHSLHATYKPQPRLSPSAGGISLAFSMLLSCLPSKFLSQSRGRLCGAVFPNLRLSKAPDVYVK